MKYRLAVITKPTAPAVFLADVKTHARIDASTEDDLIATWIQSGTDLVESYLGRAFMTQTLQMTLNKFPGEVLELPRWPVVSIEQIEYTDSAGTVAEVDTDIYRLSITGEPALLVRKYGQSWPNVTLDNYDAVRIEFVAGHASHEDVPANVKDAIYLYCNWRYENRIAEDGEVPEAFYHLLRPERVVRF